MKDKIITLVNGVELYVIDEQTLDNRVYALGVEIDKSKELIKDNYMMFEVLTKADGGFSLTSIKDDSLTELLSNLFAKTINSI